MPNDKILARSLGVLFGLGLAGIFILRRNLFRLTGGKDNGAFIEYFELLPPPPPPPPSAPHPLSGLTFAIKDIFDIEGFVTGFGNPDWASTHEPATRTAAAVKVLVEAGATCIGKLIMDELAYSIIGDNKHYGTPVNPAAPNRIPGGSSSGSGVAVAADLVDFSLGTDTAGSVRVPAAFCGILGFRPSHGAVSTVGVTPMAQSLDTVGCFARDPAILRQVGHILLQLPYMDVRQPRRFFIADDCFKISLIPTELSLGTVVKSIQKLLGRQVLQHINLGDYVARTVPSLKELQKEISDSNLGSLALLRTAMQILQRWEFKLNHEEWLTTVKPDLAPALAARTKLALETSSNLVPLLQKIKDETRYAISELLKNDSLLVMPTVPDIPPKLNTKAEALEVFRNKTLDLICVAGMSSCCQVTMPAGNHDGVPMAVSLLAKQGSDRFLLDTVLAIYSTVQEEDKVAADQPSIVSDGNSAAAELAKEKGNAAFKEKDYKKAVGFYTDAIRLNGNNATYYNNRAMAYLQLCSFSEAESDCTKALNLDKRSVKAYLRRGTAREFLGYYKEADEDFRQALIFEPTNKTASEALSRLKKLLYG
uniref:Chloroplast Toc64-1 n=1 Tax=Physcomitrium patens TaxID=3218 RepID=Q6RJN7_PHYPA|nr:chloroplast Toc64-1 [Physcomitrium patens]